MGERDDLEKERLGTGSILRESWRIYRAVFVVASLICLIVLVPSELYSYLTRDSPLSLIPFDIVASAWQIGGLVLLVEAVQHGTTGKRSAPQYLGAAFPRLFWLTLLYLFAGVLCAFGLLALIVPGIVLVLMWFVAMPVMMVEGAGVFESMGRSSDLTRRLRMRMLGTGAVVAFPAILLGGISFLTRSVDPALLAVWNVAAGTLVGSFTTIVVTVVYFRLVALRPPLRS